MGGWGDTGCHMSELVLSQAPWEFIWPPSSGQRSRGKLETGTGGGDGEGLDPRVVGETLKYQNKLFVQILTPYHISTFTSHLLKSVHPSFAPI